LQRSSPLRWRKYSLVASVGLTLGLAGLIAKLAFSDGPAARVDAAPPTPKAAMPEPTAAQSPPQAEPAAEPSARPAPSAEPAPADEFSEDLKRRKLGYLTIHSSDPR